MISLFILINTIFDIMIATVFASFIASWLVFFGVVNMRNRVIYVIVDMLNRLTEPLYRPIRRIIPTFGGIDISPMILLLLLYFLQNLLHEYFNPFALHAL